MPLNIRTYRQLTEPDRSALPEQIGAQRRRVAERLATVRRVVAVMSGKGGVGKSFVTAGLARALARQGRATGVLDADFNGPTAARLLEAREARQPLGFRGPEAESFVWRGTLEAATLREFLADVAWGALDQLFVDLPPGMQRFAELTELVPHAPAVLTVTIPTVESRDAVRRAMRHAVACGATLLGVVENMVGGPLTGSAAADLSAEFAVPVLARIPWHPGAEVWDLLAGRL